MSILYITGRGADSRLITLNCDSGYLITISTTELPTGATLFGEIARLDWSVYE
jgi:hypothetical protein